MVFRFCILILFACNALSAWSQDIENEHLKGLESLSRFAIEVYEVQKENVPEESPEILLDSAVAEFDPVKIRAVLKDNTQLKDFRDIYLKTATIFEGEETTVDNETINWLSNCSETEPAYRSHKCAITLAYIYLSEFDIANVLEWSDRANKITASLPISDKRYWYMQFQSNELLLIALIYDRNLEEAIYAGNMYVEAAQKSNTKLDSFVVINNLAYLANSELGADSALRVLSIAEEKLDVLEDPQKGVIYYSLGKYQMMAGNFIASSTFFTEFNKLENRPDLEEASFAYIAYIDAMLGNIEKSKKQVRKAKTALNDDLSSSLGLYVLRAEKKIAVAEGNLSAALDIDVEIDRIDDILDERALSANRNRLSKNLQITNERMKRREDKLLFEAQLAAKDAKSRQTQLLLSTAALIVLAGLVAFIFRSYLREQKLNAQIKSKNVELKEVNANLSETNKDLRRTFDRLQVAHRQAMAGQDAKQKFIGVVGHELRTPLNPIINLSEVLEAKETNPQDKALLKAIKNAGKRLHIIVENMLAISSADKDSRVFIEMVDVVYETKMVVEEFIPDMRERNQALESEGQFLNVNVYKHPNLKLHQVSNKIIFRSMVRNLFDNAMKFTLHGDISVHLQPRPNGEGFQLEVRDSGPGMDAGKIDQFTRPFEQAEMGLGRSHEGAGLGLAVVQKYCEQLGAKMQIKSTIGQGTTVCIDFPEPAHESDTGKLLKVA